MSAKPFSTLALTLFAYTTLVGNYYYAEMNISYLYKDALKNKVFINCYRLIAVVIIFLGAQFSAGLAWDLADVLMGFMALINVPVCVILGGKAFDALKDYLSQKSAGKDPEFKASDIGIQQGFKICRVIGLYLEDPVCVSVFVDQIGFLFKAFIKSHNFTINRRINI